MTIKIPEGMEITPEDMKRKEIEALATFDIDEENGELTLTSIDGVPVEAEVEDEEMEEEAPIPTKEETIGDFVKGQLAAKGK